MIINIVSAMNIGELSREIAYGATLTPLGFFKNDSSMLFALDYKNVTEKLYVINASYTRIVNKYSDDIEGRMRRFMRDVNFSNDFELRIRM